MFSVGHTEAHALATRGCAPPVQVCIRIIGADSKLSLSIANRALNDLQIERRSIAMFIHRITCLVRSPYVRVSRILNKVTYTALQYGLRTDLGGCQISKIFWKSMPQTPLNTSALRAEFRRNVVCPCCALASAMSWLRHWSFTRGSERYAHSVIP